MGLNPLALLEGNMAFEGLGVPPLWGYNEYNIETVDDLKKRLHDTTMELQNFQLTAMEEMEKKENDIRNLIHLFNKTCQERDEAREQLEILLKKVMPINHIEPNSESPQISKSDNSLSHASSPIESLLDMENSPELSNVNMADSYNIGVAQKGIYSNNVRYQQLVSNNKRALPEKGKMLDAVMKAGPLLQSLLVAGSLPRWKNPPPVRPLSIPSVSVTSPNQHKMNPAATMIANVMLHNSVNGLHTENTMAMVKRPMVMAMGMASHSSSSKRQRSQ